MDVVINFIRDLFKLKQITGLTRTQMTSFIKAKSSYFRVEKSKAAFTLTACFCVHAFACVNALSFAFSCSD